MILFRIMRMVPALMAVMLIAGLAYAEDLPLPWAVGDAVGWEYRITGIERHAEFVRLSVEGGGVKTAVEITYNLEEPGEFATVHYRVQPAPGERSPAGLLKRFKAVLDELEASTGGALLVKKTSVEEKPGPAPVEAEASVLEEEPSPSKDLDVTPVGFLQLFGFSNGKTRALVFLTVVFLLAVLFRFLYSRHRKEAAQPASAIGEVPRVFEVFQAGNIVISSYLLLLTVGSCVFGFQHTLQWGGQWFLYFLPDSIVLLAWSLLLQVAYFLWPGRPRYLLGLCLLGLVTGFLLICETISWIVLGTVLGLAVGVRAVLRYRCMLIQSSTATLVAHLGFIVVFLAILGSITVGPRVNRLGLVSFPPGTEREIDYSGRSNKDNYPVCCFKYNSLGYRDREPVWEPRDQILIVGDSYVWGDGIPDGRQTLGALLRERLEEAEPGRFGVVSAAYPGNGIYGYSRFITALEPRLRPKVVVIGYLGFADLDPLDAQYLMDFLPKSGFWRNLAVNLRFLQDVHEKSVTIGNPLWLQEPPLSRIAGALDAIVVNPPPSRRCVIVIDYFLRKDKHPLAFPKDWRVVQLPKPLQYPGHRTQYWYAKDIHPKPALNFRLAEILSDTVRDCVGK